MQNKLSLKTTSTALVVTSNHHSACIAAEAEIVYRLRQVGYEIYSIDLNYLTGHVHFNARQADKLLHKIRNRYKRIHLKKLKTRDLTGFCRKYLPKIKPPKPPELVAELRSYVIDRINIGLAALSSAASFSRCCSPYTKDYGRYLEEAWRLSHASYEIADFIKLLKFDLCYIFNGRHSLQRPIVEVLIQAGVEVRVYEFPDSGYSGYFDWNANNLYDEAFLREQLEYSKESLVIQDGIDYLSRSIARAEGTPGHMMRANQIAGTNLAIKEKYIAFFTSSPDEYFAISDNPAISADFSTQYQVAEFMAQLMCSTDKILVIRFHPHLRLKHPSWISEWNFKLLSNLGVILISPDDVTDSYEILKNSTGVVTCGSTIGVEACFLEKPVGVASSSYLGAIGCGTDVSTKEALKNFVLNPKFHSSHYHAAVRYSAWLCTPSYPFSICTSDPAKGFKLYKEYI